MLAGSCHNGYEGSAVATYIGNREKTVVYTEGILPAYQIVGSWNCNFIKENASANLNFILCLMKMV